MKLLMKQLTKELLKNKIFLALMLILTAFTSFMYFFVHFSVDANMALLNAQDILSDKQLLYRNALASNTTLASNILTAFTSLTAFVFLMFFYRFFKENGKMLGCLKSIGFKDKVLSSFFTVFAALFSIVGELIGLCAGFLASDVLNTASIQTYLVTDLVKGISIISFSIGIFAPMAVFCAITFLSYNIIRGKEASVLISEAYSESGYWATLLLADKISSLFPEKRRFTVRLAFRKPIAVLLIIISVMTFSIMSILGYSLALSSARVLKSQTIGHNYLFETHYDATQTGDVSSDKTAFYIDTKGVVKGRNISVEATVAGVEENTEIFELLADNGRAIQFPKQGEVVIGSQLQELYGFKAGEEVTLLIGDNEYIMKISGIAFNAKSNWIYISKNELAQMLSLPMNSFTGAFSMENILEGGMVITNAQKLNELERGAVSNRVSAMINHIVGVLIGCILLFLALLLNFQSSTRDILILQLIGYKRKSIKKILIDIYQPIVWLSFFLTLLPAIQIVKAILKSLSIQIGDYMPFQTNIIIIVGIFVLLNIIYFGVQATFNIGIGKVIKRESIGEYTVDTVYSL